MPKTGIFIPVFLCLNQRLARDQYAIIVAVGGQVSEDFAWAIPIDAP
jgi:hypothetical protein